MGAVLQQNRVPLRVDPVSVGIAGTTTNLDIIFTPTTKHLFTISGYKYPLKLGGHHRPKRRHQKECLPDAYNELPPKVSYLQKPWAIDSLVSAITELLHQQSPLRPSR